MKRARSLFFFSFLFVSTIFMGTAAIIGSFISRGWPNFVARHWARLNLWTACAKVEVHGGKNLDPNGTYILASNHQGWFDIFAILAYFPIDFAWIAKEELFRLPVLGRAMRSAGYIPIDRSDRHKALASMNAAAEKIRNGTSVFIFPEGTRSVNGVLRQFKKGGFVLAAKSQRPIVPVSISGSYLIMPNGRWLIQPGKIIITIREPVYAAGADAVSRDQLMKIVRDEIRANLTPEEAGVDSEEEQQGPAPGPQAENGGGLGRNP